jgi:hypothetical protein
LKVANEPAKRVRKDHQEHPADDRKRYGPLTRTPNKRHKGKNADEKQNVKTMPLAKTPSGEQRADDS